MLSEMLIWPKLPVASIIVIGVSVVLLMYALRSHSRDLITRVSKILHRSFRLLAKGCLKAEYRVRCRNHEVAKALVEELRERRLQRQFLRIEALVERDLTNYLELSGQINRRLSQIDEDYTATTAVPLTPPEWVAAVDAIAQLKDDERNSEVVGKILNDMHQTVQQHQRDVLREYRWNVTARHKILTRLKPHWRRLERKLDEIGHKIDLLRTKLQRADHQMAYFEALTSGVGDGLLASIAVRFLIAALFLGVVSVVALVNYQLLLTPVTLIFKSSLPLGSELPAGQLLSGAIVALQVIAGAIIAEGLRISRLFPLVSVATQRGRQVMITIGTALLIALAGIEGAMLGFSGVVEADQQILPYSQWMLFSLGFVIPVFVAILAVPLEYTLLTIRPVIASIFQALLHGSAFVSRMIGALALESGRLLCELYDLLIFIPLRVESEWRSRQAAGQSAESPISARFNMPSDDSSSQNVTAVDFTNSIQRGTDR